MLLTRMMDDRPAEDNVNAICGVLCVVAAQLFLPFALYVYVRPHWQRATQKKSRIPNIESYVT